LTLKQAQEHGPFLTINPPVILEVKRESSKDTLSIEKIQAALLQSPLALDGIKADQRACQVN
jgi:hypothetical protein